MKFLKQDRRALESLPVAILALGPLNTTEEAFSRSRRQLSHSLAGLQWLAPVSIELFGGADPPSAKAPTGVTYETGRQFWRGRTRCRGGCSGLGHSGKNRRSFVARMSSFQLS